MIDNESKVSTNYKRMVGEAVAELYRLGDDGITKGEIREKQLGVLREAMRRVFGDLVLDGVGNPFNGGTFLFTKGKSSNYKYLNLSAGEKSAFDILLDFIIKREYYNDTIYCIDEPEVHLSSIVQATLLKELYNLLPKNCQLIISTHSIGMMRAAFDLYKLDPSTVSFINFSSLNLDEEATIEPSIVNRKFWKDVFSIAIDDMIDLINPDVLILCEGRMIDGSKKRNTEFDAKVYRSIFSSTEPNVEFFSVGGSSEVANGEVILTALLGQVSKGTNIKSVYDLDDNSEEDVRALNAKGVSVLKKRDLENYVWDDEILEKLCIHYGKPQIVGEVLAEKSRLLAEKIAIAGVPQDDIKSISGSLYVFVKRILNITQGGNNKDSFCYSTLAPLITPETNIYKELHFIIFQD